MKAIITVILLFIFTIGTTQSVKELHTRATMEKYTVSKDGVKTKSSTKKGVFSIQFDSTLHITIWDGTKRIVSLLITNSNVSSDRQAEIFSVLIEPDDSWAPLKPAVLIMQFNSVIEYYDGIFKEDGSHDITEYWRFLAC
ncbi:MAG: hypothetical protein WDZ35_07935 [Crocinitomicaceae bacterium]